MFRWTTLLLVFPVLLFLTLLGIPLSLSFILLPFPNKYLGMGGWLSWWSLEYKDKLTAIYMTLSLVLQIFLTAAIIIRLLKCKAEAKSVLGRNNVGHYGFLSIVFAESATMNVICATFLFTASLPDWFQKSYVFHSGNWWKFTHNCFPVLLAITPAIQVRISQGWLFSHSHCCAIGMFQLSHHLQGR